MSYWKEIHEWSEKIFRTVLWRTFGEEHQWGQTEEPAKKVSETLWQPCYLQQSIKRQEKYDPVKAYQRFKQYRRRRFFFRYGVAAGILLLISFSCYLFIHQQKRNLPLSVAVMAKQIQPGEKKAVLTLADGSVWSVQDSSMNIKTSFEEVIRIDSNGLVMPEEPTKKQPDEEGRDNVLSVPRGGEFCLTLPDRSRVWLNSESEIRFPLRFSQHSREVILKGEAYFEVTKNPKVPFRVKLDKGEITVYGTEFNISNYEQEELSATLVSGEIGFKSVKGASVKLTPSQHLKYHATDDKISVEMVDTRLYTSWKDHLFCFEDEPLEKIMETLARWYDVEVSFKSDELRTKKLSGTLDKYDDIIPFLKLFEVGTEVRFEVNQRKIQVFKN